MAAGDIKAGWGADSALTITLASLASSAGLTAGRESAAYDNSTAKDPDVLISGKISVGTTPTANTSIEVWVVAPIEDTPTWPDVFDGTDSDETVTNREVLLSCGRLGAVISVVATTSNVAYPIAPFSVAQLFGGNMPARFVLFVVHNTGAALNSTGSNHEIRVQPQQPTIAQS